MEQKNKIGLIAFILAIIALTASAQTIYNAITCTNCILDNPIFLNFSGNFSSSQIINLSSDLNTKVNKSNISEVYGGKLGFDFMDTDSLAKLTTINNFIGGNNIAITSMVPGMYNTLDRDNANQYDYVTFATSGTKKFSIGLKDDGTDDFHVYDYGGNDVLRFNFVNGRAYLPTIRNLQQASAVCYNATTDELTYNSGVTSCISSSEKYKINVTYINQTASTLLMKLKPVFYTEKYGDQRNKIGFIAEDIYRDIPAYRDYAITYELKNESDASQGYNLTNPRSLNYEAFTVLAIKVIQEQQVTINKICTKNPSLCQ